MMKTNIAMVGVCLAMACSVPGKSVGVETNDGDGGAEGDDGAQTDDGGMDAGQSESDGASDDGPGDDGPGDDGSCPPVGPPVVPDCATCTLAPDCTPLCDFSACNLDCADDVCGDACVVCTAEDDCLDWVEGVCDATAQCIDADTPIVCGGGLQEGFEQDLENQSGCADMLLYAGSADDSLGLVVFLPDWGVNDVTEATEWMDVSYDAAQVLEVRVGSDVTTLECNDAISKKPVIDALWTAVGGTLNVTVTPGEGGANPTATVELTNVTFEDVAGDSVVMPAYSFDSISVGWLPG